MSRVFLAEERSLGRRVVVKVLPPDLAGGVSIQRFEREISLAARLQHPHIVPLLSAGVSDGLAYFTMPFVDGESLRARLVRDGELPVAEGVRVLREVATALEYAHNQGIVHRDIKPDNVLLSHGSAMVTDFGVAKALSASTNAEHGGITSLGIALGTPAYMSPEQAAAAPNIDGRADVYSFGVLAYEILAGRPPFAGRQPQALLAAHVSEPPESIQKLRPSLPPTLAALVMRCLEKRPADRPQRASEIVQALDAIVTPSGRSAPTVGLQARTRVGLALAIAAAITIAVVGFAIARRGPRQASPSASKTAAIAVLPFAVGQDTASRYFADGLTEELINALAAIPTVRVIARASVFALRDSDLADAAALGKRLGVTLLIEGNVRRTPSAIKVSAELVDAATNAVVMSRSVERPAGDVFTLEDSVAHQIVTGLEAKLGISLAGVGMRRGTSNQDAYDRFLKAEYYANRFTEKDYHTAIALYRESLRLDSTFARPWAGIANVWSSLADAWIEPSKAYPVAEAAARKALALDSSLAEAHAQLGMSVFLYDRDYERGYRELQRAVALDSNSVGAHMALAFAFAAFGVRDSSVLHARRIIALDSLSMSNMATAAMTFSFAHDLDDAVATLKRLRRLGGLGGAPLEIAGVYWHFGRRSEADSIMRSACAQRGVCDTSIVALVIRGDTARARILIEAGERETRLSGHYVNPVTVAINRCLVGDTAAALRALDQALEERTASVTEIGAIPVFDGLHTNPRFKALLHRAGLDVPLLRAP
jgi:serine/threonine-protein kinase